jgi:hypothetical protein
MHNTDRIAEIVNQVLAVLNEKKVSPEEGFRVAEEILFASMEGMAKLHNVSVEEIQSKMAETMLGVQKEHSPRGFQIGKGHGWIGNPKTITENN